jgi:hypothetical protein
MSLHVHEAIVTVVATTMVELGLTRQEAVEHIIANVNLRVDERVALASYVRRHKLSIPTEMVVVPHGSWHD